jgi:hypothetical protein
VYYLQICDRYIEYRCERVVPIVAASPYTCPAKLEDLTTSLVRDLPGYANRLIQRRRKRTDPVYSSIVNVGAPELKPLAIASREYPIQFPQAAPQQVFITTLERQYTGIRSAELQQFHWLFMVQTRLGWRLVNIYSSTGGTPRANTPVSPPIESSNTAVAEGIRLWLNDCHLGKVKPAS